MSMHMAFIIVNYYNYSILSLVIVHILLLIYKLNFMVCLEDMHACTR